MSVPYGRMAHKIALVASGLVLLVTVAAGVVELRQSGRLLPPLQIDHLEQANAVAVAGDLPRALRLFDAHLQISPKDHFALMNEALIYTQMSNWPAAETYWLRAGAENFEQRGYAVFMAGYSSLRLAQAESDPGQQRDLIARASAHIAQAQELGHAGDPRVIQSLEIAKRALGVP